MLDSPAPEGKTWMCQRCGNCCRWPGLVRVTGKEIDIIADYLKMDPEDFLEEYVEVTPDRRGLTLISRPDHSCIFLEEPSKCLINEVKPIQCGGFPNTWNFAGWRDKCEARLVDKDSFEQEARKRDQDFERNNQ